MKPPLDRVIAALKGVLERITRGIERKRAPGRASAAGAKGGAGDLADEDALIEPGEATAPKAAGRRAPLASIDLKEVLEDLSKRKGLLACLAAALVFLLGLAITAIVVGAPAKPMAAPPRATREGADLARRLVVPPRSSLAPRMAMEREGAAPYTARDAVELGIGDSAAGLAGDSAADLGGLSARNDAEADGLYGTVR